MQSRRPRRYRLLPIAFILVLALVPPAFGVAAPGRPRVPVLIIDAGLGDSPVWLSQWLGPGATGEQRSGSTVRLWRAKTPVWWTGAQPATYLLASSTETGGPAPGPVTPEDIGWALDRITSSDPSLKVMLVAQGAAGLQARAYLEDLGKPRYTGREDVVGLVLVGTPNAGAEMAGTFPRLDVWAPMAAGAGLNAPDLLPGSPWLAALNGRALPATARVAVLRGSSGRMGGFDSDGLVTKADSTVPTSVAGDVTYAGTGSKASQGWPLVKSWSALTKREGATTGTVDERLVEQFGFDRAYPADPRVREAVASLYAAWFADRLPTTHISTRLVVDVSGSMAAAWSGTTKLEGARRAAVDFGNALKSRTSLPGSTPEDIGLILFATQPQLALRPTADPGPIAGLLGRANAKSNTDVGKALQMAVDSFGSTPRSADKTILLLSDGLPTEGMDKNAILSGPVAKAKAAGIRVSTVALGDVGDKDTAFLDAIAKQTGGRFSQSNDLFELRRDFMRARFASLGTLLADKQVKGTQRVDLAKATSTTRRIEAGVVLEGAGDVRVLRDGKALPPEAAGVQKGDGVVLVQLRKPQPGAYSLEVASASGRAQVFAVAEADVFVDKTIAAPRDDSAMLMLGILGGVLVLGVGATVFVSMRSKRAGAERKEEEVA